MVETVLVSTVGMEGGGAGKGGGSHSPSSLQLTPNPPPNFLGTPKFWKRFSTLNSRPIIC